MTISLYTGAPGHGKTLSAVAELVEREIPSGRPIYLNIEGFDCAAHENVHWLDDPRAWHELPERALIVIDECQHWFPPRHFSKEVPAHVAALAEHRHRAQDVWLITQHPSSIDSFAKHRVGRHVHVFRAFNLQSTTRYEWQVVNDDPTPGQSAATAVTKRVRFDRKLYGLYHSAVAHDTRLRLPWKPIALLGGSFALVLACIGYVWLWYFSPLLGAGEVQASELAQLTPLAGSAAPWPAAEAAGCAWVFVRRERGGVVLVELATARQVLARGPVAGKVCRVAAPGPRRQAPELRALTASTTPGVTATRYVKRNAP